MTAIRADVAIAEFRKLGIPEQTIEAFFESIAKSPRVWRHFERFALEAVQSGRKMGAKAVMERVRWETEIEQSQEFKVSNSWTAYYARLFAIKYPYYRDYFDFKQVQGVSV